MIVLRTGLPEAARKSGADRPRRSDIGPAWSAIPSQPDLDFKDPDLSHQNIFKGHPYGATRLTRH